jgi:ketosteroid isomerase-like protein
MKHATSTYVRPSRLPLARMLAVGVVVFIAFAAVPAAAASAPKLKDPAATGEKLATKFLTLLQTKDVKGLAAFLDPSFQLQRADGTGATKSEYVANPATVASFEIGPQLTAVQAGDVLTVRWQLEVDVQVDGTQYRTTEAPRLSVFRWDGRQWRMVSHANFNVPA